MKIITHRFFVENKRVIGTKPQPTDVLQKTEGYLKRKAEFNKRIKPTGFGILYDNQRMFWGVAGYFVRLKNKGMTSQEKEMGVEGLNMVAQFINVFDVEIHGY